MFPRKASPPRNIRNSDSDISHAVRNPLPSSLHASACTPDSSAQAATAQSPQAQSVSAKCILPPFAYPDSFLSLSQDSKSIPALHAPYHISSRLLSQLRRIIFSPFFPTGIRLLQDPELRRAWAAPPHETKSQDRSEEKRKEKGKKKSTEIRWGKREREIKERKDRVNAEE